MRNDTARHETASLRAREQALLLRLLEGQSVPAAAKSAGVSRRTGYRILAREDFQAALAAAKHEMLSAALGTLRNHASDFIATLHEIAVNPERKGSERVQAADRGLQALFKASEIYELEGRLQTLEQIVGEGDK